MRTSVAKTARWLHIYLSMVSFAVVLFFAVTGLTLNHPNWFSNAVRTREAHGLVEQALLEPKGSSEAEKDALIQSLRTREHLHGAVSDVREEDDAVSFSFRAPGYSADVSVDRQKGTYAITEVKNGLVAVMNDLHTGHDSGRAWGWVIDFSAILLSLVSLSGLLILWFIYKRRLSGLVTAAVGLALCLIVYKIFVP